MAGTALFVAAGVLLLAAILRLRQARLTLREGRQNLTQRNEFLGMMAHEMLTPLQTIISSVELIELGRRLPADDPTFRRLRRSAQQLEAQMNDTIEFSRLSGGRLKVSPMLFQPDLMMETIVAEYAEAARERGVQLTVSIDPQPCRRVITDPARMRQIIVNLISNATKYATPGEVLCSLRLQESPAQITIAVMDQGPGFDPGVNIWAPFVRSSQAQSGSGLGLAVVKLMAELLRGTVRVVGSTGEGSAFIVQIPVQIETAPEPKVAAPCAHRLRVLVVDDHEDVRSSLSVMLQALGVRVDTADSVAQADSMLRAKKYSGILLDLRLSDGSGYRVAERVRVAGVLNEATPIVALSAYHEPEVAGDALFAAKFEKPITVARLRAALQSFA